MDEIKKLVLAFESTPFGYSTSSEMSNEVKTLVLAYNSTPYWAAGGTVETIITGNVKRILKVDWPYVKTIINVEG